MVQKKIIGIITAILFTAASLQAKVEMPSIFGDNMVLQQKTDVALWGKATGKKVTITASWTKKKTVVTPDSDGKWFVRIPTPEAGGPYELSLNDGDKLTFHNVMLGEVWYCGGQSNMEMPVRGFQGQPVEHSTDYIVNAKPSVPIRVCDIPNKKAAAPRDTCEGVWKVNCPETVFLTSAVAYFFACKLHEILEIPIGIITVDWGGSCIEAWMSRETLEREFPGEFDPSFLDRGEADGKNAHTPCILYNGMVSAIAPYTFKGMIWYQGESNRDRAEQYARLQVSYVKMMRELFQNPDAPFYFTQIAPYPYGIYGDMFTQGYFYEAQQKTLDLIPNSGMIPTLDLGSYYIIHPPKKLEVGNRLAYMALVRNYGLKGIKIDAPRYKSVSFEGEKAIVTFEADNLGLAPRKTPVGGFELAGEDRVFHPAVGEADNNKVTVTSEEVKAPVAVRYCFRNWAEATLFNVYGIPALPFRTDDWNDLRK